VDLSVVLDWLLGVEFLCCEYVVGFLGVLGGGYGGGGFWFWGCMGGGFECFFISGVFGGGDFGGSCFVVVGRGGVCVRWGV